MRSWRAEYIWLGLIAALLLSIWWLPGASSINSDSYSVSHNGKKVLYQAMRRLDVNVNRSIQELVPRSGYPDRLLLLGPARNPSEAEWKQLYDEVQSGAVLVFAARMMAAEVDLGPFGAKVQTMQLTKQVLATDDEEEPAEAADEKATTKDKTKEATTDKKPANNKAGESATAKEPDAEQGDDRPRDDKFRKFASSWFIHDAPAETDLVPSPVSWRTQGFLELNGAGWQVLVKSESRPQVAKRQIGAGAIVLLASDDVFSNGALTKQSQALLAFRILDAVPHFENTWFDETLNSSGVPKVLGILFDPFLRPLTLQLILICALFGWAGSVRFGPVNHVISYRRRSIVEHVQAVGVLYYRAAAGAHAIRALHELLKLELRRLYGSSFRVDNAEAIARVAQMDQAEVQSVLQQTNVDHAKLSTGAAGKRLKQISQLIARIRTET